MLTPKQKQIFEYIKKFTRKKGYSPTQKEIGKHFGLAKSTIHQYIKTLKEKGYLNKLDYQARTIEIIENKKTSGLVNILLRGTIAAGQPIEAIEDKETIAVPKDKLPRTGEIYALRVTGDSMIDENISDGDIILVKQQGVAENGQKVIALIDNYEATLKKFYKEKNSIRLQPANKSIEPIIIKGNQDLLIQGIVIDVIKSNISRKEPRHTNVKKSKQSKEKKIDNLLNQVIEGDCLEAIKDIPTETIDMILCDLPYGTTQNQWDSLIPLDELWKNYERIIKDSGVIALTAQGTFTAKLILSNPKLFKYKIVWVKSKPTNFLNAKKQPLRKHEDVLIFYKKQPKYKPQMSFGEPYNKGFRKDQLTGSYGDFRTIEVKSSGERYPTDIVYFKTAESEGPVYHPTQKPIELGRYLIRTFTNPGDVVLDNTCGSGSFLVAAVLEERKFIGIEKNQEVYLFKNKKIDYIKVCNQRIKEAKERFRLESNKLL